MTALGPLLAAARARFLASSDSPGLDAQLLMAHVLDAGRAHVIAHPERELTPAQEARFAALVERRAAGEPMAYILGQRAFYDRTFNVTPDVLIPRPETETLVELAIAAPQAQRPGAVIVDIGAGSGAIAITVAAHCPQASVHAVDISAGALDVARSNAALNGVALTFHHGDLLAPIIDAALTVAEGLDISVCLHTDGLNEAVEFSDTIEATRGRTLHAYHVEGAGGGHTPDALMMATREHIIASSTTPTVPHGVGAVPEHINMMSIMHGQNYGLPENVEAVRLRIRSTSMEAEDLLHEMGAINIINSDSQGMGRIQETVRRTWQLADANKARGIATGDVVEGTNDNDRILQYLAKYTINPAVTHGIADYVGSLEVGKLADIVLWDPRFFGVKPETVIKGGQVAWAPRGDGNASARLAEPVVYGPMWGGLGKAIDRLAVNFVAEAAIEAGVKERIKSNREFLPTKGARGIGKRNLVRNAASPALRIDAMTGEVWADGKRLVCEPLETVSLGRKYLLS